jgi:ABC-2 type transport system ATP-binding protein
VDPVSRREFWKLLAECLADGITILMSTPYLDEAERCTRVALLHQGRALAVDTPARLRDQLPGRMVEIVAPMAGALATVRTLTGVVDAQQFGERLHVRLSAGSRGGDSPDAFDAFAAALRQSPLAGASLRVVPASLEDVFIARLSEKSEKEEAHA